MNLLGSALYDPAAAVSKATSALLAMTAFDTTNLRLAITVPAHGKVLFKLRTTITGATTVPTVFLGVMNGATVLGRVTPQDFPGTMNAATQSCPCQAEFVVTGLTPGALNADAAYGVEVVVAATNIKYGGPNDTTTNNAWGAFVFEAWDPQPLKLALDGGVNVTQYGGTAGTFSAGRPEVNTTHAAGTAWGSGAITAGALAADCITAAKVANGAIDAATFASGAIDATAFAQGAADKVWATAARVLTAGTNIALAKGTGVTGFNDLSAAQVNAECDTALVDVGLTTTITGRIDAAVTTRMATYTQPTGFLAATFPASVASPTNITAGTITTVTNLTNAPTAGDFTAVMKTSIGTAVAASAVASVTGNVGGNVAGSVGSVTGNVGGNVTGSVGSVVGLTAANLDVAVSTRLASGSYVLPDNATIATINSKLGVPAVTVSADIAAVKSDTGAIKLKTDSLNFTVAGKVDSNILVVNGITVNGNGTAATPWGP